jgi:hypothetical protein
MKKIKLVINPYTGELEPEVWKDVVGYEGLYEVSNYGRVKSLRKKIVKSTGAEVWFPTIILTPVMRYMYKAVNIYKNKKATMFSIHRLVAKAFIENPTNLKIVNHKDLDKFNNRLFNLEWCTPLENTRHAIRNNAGAAPPQGEKNGQSILTEANVHVIKNSRYKIKRKDLAKMFNVSIKHIDRVRCGERWGHIK